MSLFPKSRWEGWASEWGLIHVPTNPWLGGPEIVAGVRKGFVVSAVWRFGRTDVLAVRVGFSHVDDVEGLKVILVADQSLDILPGGFARREKMAAVKQASGFMIRRSDYILWPDLLEWAPRVDRLRDAAAQTPLWTDTIVDALARAASPLALRCEDCSSQDDARVVLVKDRVKVLCPTCRQKRGIMGRIAAAA